MHDVQDEAFYIFYGAISLAHYVLGESRDGEELSRRPLNPWLNPAVLLKWRHARSHSLPIMCALQSQREPLGAYLKLVTVAVQFKGSRALWEKRKYTTWLPARSHREAERQLCINGRRVHTDTHTKCQCTAPQNRHFFAAALVVFFLAKVHIKNLVQWTARRDRSGCSRSLRTP
jgi:hypothetical protein